MLVENLPVPFDRRVWMESRTLRDAGHQVTVICPAGTYPVGRETIDGITIYRYPLLSLRGIAGHLLEYVAALVFTFGLACVAFVRDGFDVIHTANPPDLNYLVGRFFKLLGCRFIFDHHDLMPETCSTRWSGWKLRLLLPAVRHTERASFRAADIVISTNESYRVIAVERGHVPEGRAFVVRSAPMRDRFKPCPPDPSLRAGFAHLVVYLGVMGPNDGLELLVESIAHTVHARHRGDVRFVLIGDGDERPKVVRMVRQLDLEHCTFFTGRIADVEVIAYVSTADVCVAPDPKDALNDVSSMNKIVEYMALGRPIVAFNLRETMKTARGAARYAPANDVMAFGDLVLQLLDSPAIRHRMGACGRRRFLDELAWERQQQQLLLAYSMLQAGPVALST